MELKRSRFTKEDRCFFAGIILFSVVACVYYFDHIMSQYNASLYALSYKYGLLSRGIVGTVWQWFDRILPFDLMNYNAIYVGNIFVTALIYILVFLFLMYCVGKVDGENKRNIKYLIVFFMIFTIPMFVTKQNLGRIDIFLIAISIICVWLIIIEKAEWLIIPLCIFAMLIHQGFVFTNINIILVLLNVNNEYQKKSKCLTIT